MALVVLLFALPLGITFYQFADRTLKSAIQEKRQKDAAQIANNALTDYMRQFAQDAYNGHYDLDSLARPEIFYSAGYSTATFIADSVNRTIYIKASGIYGTSANPLTTQGLEALIQFSADLVQYGTMFNAAQTLSYPNIVYKGGFYVNGDFTDTAANVIFDGGPVLIRGKFAGAATTRVNGDAFVSGAVTGGVVVSGTRYFYVPTVGWPQLDFKYYDAHYTYKATANKNIVFNTTGTFTVDGVNYAIPSNGAIVYCDNCSFTVRTSTIAGRVTLVAGASAAGSCSSAAGQITFLGSVYYAGASSITASASNSFAALARNCINWGAASSNRPVNILTVGVHFVQEGTQNMKCLGTATGRQWIYGNRTQVITGAGWSAGTAIVYDPNLRSYPPPGLPEKAYLVNWKMH
jgi:hypothetical protein